MGFGTTDYSSNRIFVSIIGGKFAVKSDSGNEKAVKRYSEKKQQDVYELIYPDFTGRIKSMEIRKSQFGDQLSLLMSDIGDNYEFQIPTESQYFTSFCNKVENLNFNEDVRLVPYNFESKEDKNSKGEPKRIIGINIFQNGKKIENYYSKDHQGNKPEYPKNATEAQKKIYFIQQEEYFKKLIGEINSKIPDSQAVIQDIGFNYNSEPVETESTPADDLPFTMFLTAGLSLLVKILVSGSVLAACSLV